MATKKECSCNKAKIEEERLHKRMNNIHTFQECKGELALAGTDEYGKEFTIWFDTCLSFT